MDIEQLTRPFEADIWKQFCNSCNAIKLESLIIDATHIQLELLLRIIVSFKSLEKQFPWMANRVIEDGCIYIGDRTKPEWLMEWIEKEDKLGDHVFRSIQSRVYNVHSKIPYYPLHYHHPRSLAFIALG